MACSWAFDLTADLDYIPETVSETEDTITIKDGNGAILRRHKKPCTVNEYVFWPIVAPSGPIVSSFTVAVPLDDDGIADSHEVGIVYDVDVTPAATDCV